MRGMFQSRAQLSRLCQKLVTYAGTILPHINTANSIQFDTATAVKWLLEKYGLWRYVEQREKRVAVAATVDGGWLGSSFRSLLELKFVMKRQ
jgi:hypothetical protein